jgi:hypothetical protein
MRLLTNKKLGKERISIGTKTTTKEFCHKVVLVATVSNSKGVTATVIGRNYVILSH